MNFHNFFMTILMMNQLSGSPSAKAGEELCFNRHAICNFSSNLPVSYCTLSEEDKSERRQVLSNQLNQYNVVWNSPSTDYNGTMPIGNGDIAANVWVEPNGDLLFYLSKSDAWSSNQELLKLGRVRIRLDQPLVREGIKFKQELELKSGTIHIQSVGNQKTSIRFWIDANNPVVNVEIKSGNAFSAQVMLEPWRVPGTSLYGGAVPDVLFPADDSTIGWYQRNSGSIYEETLKNQNLGQFMGKYPDPLKNLTFGGVIVGKGMKCIDSKTLLTPNKISDLSLKIHVLTAATTTPEEWIQKLREQRAIVENHPIEMTRAKHEAYWADFWKRSWIFVNPRKDGVAGKVPPLIPANGHLFRAGADANNGNHLAGIFGRMTLLNRALSAAEIKDLASQQGQETADKHGSSVLYGESPIIGTAIPKSVEWANLPQLTFETWLKPTAENPGSRILDKATPGKDDGFLLDTYPGNSLRLIIGGASYAVPDCLKAEQWNHVAVAVDSETNRIEMYLNGVRIAGRSAIEKPKDEYVVTQAYVLQRWMQACAGRGGSPIKFNGSLFTVNYVHRNSDGSLQELGPDARQWGGCYWFQNTREPYWAMLYSGDYDQMAPLWKMYRDAVPLLKNRTRAYFNHDGIFCSETMHLWGLNSQGDFGYGNKDPIPVNPYIRYYWDSGIELSMMMLDYQSHTQEKKFVIDTLVPIADEVMKFYDQHYKRTENGKIRFSPSASLETWHTAEDPLSVVVGLRTVLPRLLELPQDLTTSEQRQRWKRFLSEIPDVPIGEDNGKKWIKPARVYSDQKNSENPELYAVFPYRAYTIGKRDLDVAIETWNKRLVKRTGGWTQDPIQAAMLGLTQEARSYVVTNATDKSPAGRPVNEPRFPAFWGPNFDWTPDQCHGSVTVIALQRMLMLCEGDTIQLLPAWPKDWDVSFKLHAPKQTTIECEYRNGRIERIDVQPTSRSKDVITPKQ